MKTKEQLERAIAPLKEQLDRLRDAERRAESKKLVGRYFKYRNCYSCPEKESDYWWLYVKVTGADASFQFQTDRYGRVEIEPDHYFNYSGQYVEITAKEFNAAWGALLKRVAGLKP